MTRLLSGGRLWAERNEPGDTCKLWLAEPLQPLKVRGSRHRLE
jgi:hypothetical protein